MGEGLGGGETAMQFGWCPRQRWNPGLRRESAEGTSSCGKRMNLCTSVAPEANEVGI